MDAGLCGRHSWYTYRESSLISIDQSWIHNQAVQRRSTLERKSHTTNTETGAKVAPQEPNVR